ncbi:MAG: hypothetical protein WAN61_00095 [Minisyncoccia bacterium]
MGMEGLNIPKKTVETTTSNVGATVEQVVETPSSLEQKIREAYAQLEKTNSGGMFATAQRLGLRNKIEKYKTQYKELTGTDYR